MTLEDKICLYIKGCLDTIKSAVPVNIHHWHSTTVEIQGPDSYTISGGRPDYSAAPINFENVVSSLPIPMYPYKLQELCKDQFINFSKQVKKSILIKTVVDNAERQTGGRKYKDINAVALYIICDYLLYCKSLDYDDELAVTIANNFITSLKRQKSTMIFYTVLRGMKSEINELQITKSIKIRKLTEKEIGFLMDINPLIKRRDNLPGNPFVLEEYVDIGFYDNIKKYSSYREKFYNVLLSLRLINTGNISFEDIYLQEAKLGQCRIYEFLSYQIESKYSFPSKYVFPESKVFLLKSLYNKINSLSGMEIAIKRFNASYTRKDDADKFLDLMIALETIFAKDGGDGSITYKTSMRCAKFLYVNLEERNSAYKKIKQLYGFRSKIVHGRSSSAQLKEHIKELEQILRESLKKIILSKQRLEDDKLTEYFNEMLLM